MGQGMEERDGKREAGQGRGDGRQGDSSPREQAGQGPGAGAWKMKRDINTKR